MPEKKDTRQKVTFSLNPEASNADRLALAILEPLSRHERGRVMRLCMLAGLALHQQNKSAPAVLGETLSEGQTLDQLRALLAGVMPGLVNMNAAALAEPDTQSKKNAADKGLAESFGL